MSEFSIMVRDVFTEELKTGLSDGSVVLIDVREPHEFKAGHIPGAILMPLSVFEADELPDVKGKRVIFSCRSGVRSIQALKLAQQAGLKIVDHYKPGFNGWVNEGCEVEI
jgi:rhodanese-related sulfurtransferase